jgi:hypothetical protein
VKTTYTVGVLERALSNYLRTRSFLDGHVQQIRSDGPPPKRPKTTAAREVPLGHSPSQGPWPFSEPPRAKTPFDGKTKGRAIEELMAVCIDIEDAFLATDADGNHVLPDEDAELLYRRYVYEWTLDEMCAAYGYANRYSMNRRCQRAVRNLLHVIERPHGQKLPRTPGPRPGLFR